MEAKSNKYREMGPSQQVHDANLRDNNGSEVQWYHNWDKAGIKLVSVKIS